MSIPKIADPAPPAAVVAARAAPKPAHSEPIAPTSGDRGQAKEVELAAEERRRIAQRLQELADSSGRELEFRVDEETDRMVIMVRDQRTGELIRQIPDATALRISQRLASQVETMRSVLFEGRV